MDTSQNFSKNVSSVLIQSNQGGINATEAERPPRELVAWLVQVGQRAAQAHATAEEMPCKPNTPSDQSLFTNSAPQALADQSF